jgi:hypothetical protein
MVSTNRELFRFHLARERLEVVGDGDNPTSIRVRSSGRATDVGPPVGGTAQDARVDDEAARREPARPVESGVRADEDVCLWSARSLQ